MERSLIVQDRDQDHSNNNLKEAIAASIHVVYRRELERLVNLAEARMADAAEGLEAVKSHMTAWLRQLSLGMLSIRQDLDTKVLNIDRRSLSFDSARST